MTPNASQPSSAGGASRGFSILEVLIAVSIFAVGFLAIASMTVNSNINTRTGAEMTEAATVAANQMEILSGLDFDDSQLDAGDHGPFTQGRHTLRWTVTDDAPVTDTKTINITVERPGILRGLASSRRIRLEFIKAEAM